MSMLQAIDVGIIVIDRDYGIQVWNSFMENHSGLCPENVRGKNLVNLFPEIPQEWFKHKVESVFMLHSRAFSTWEQRPYIFRFKNYRPITGTEEYMYQNISMIPLTSLDGTVKYICITVSDVTDIALSKKELKLANLQLAQQSKTDQLTQLNNRGYWEDSLMHEHKRFMRYGNKYSLVMLDIDYFKKINDTYGHQAGDKVLKTVSNILMDSVRDTDIVGRYGGEEFGVILPGNDSQGAFTFAERLRKKIDKTEIKTNENCIKITISLGIAEFKNDVESYIDHIERADRALYESKHAGRNQTTIYFEYKKTATA